MNIRLATPDDTDAIWKFWEGAEKNDSTLRCASGQHHPSHEQLEGLNPEFHVVIVEDGSIICTEIFNPTTGESWWTHCLRERVDEVFPVLFRWTNERSQIPPWGWCGIVTSVEKYVQSGFEDVDGMVRWVG